MMEFMEWLQEMSFATYVRESALFYPITLSLHLVGLGLFGGLVAMTNLRFLGVAMTNQPPGDLHRQLRPYKHLGLTLIVTCGLILGWSKAAIYWPNPYFKAKLFLLLMVAVHAVVFRPTVYNNAALEKMNQTGVIPQQAKIAAALSIVIWLGLITCGRMIGYWEPEEF